MTEWSPFENGDLFLYGDPHIEMGIRSICFPIWKRGFTLSIWGCFYLRFHMAITIWKRGTVSFSSLYGNRDHQMEMGISQGGVNPRRSPYGNGAMEQIMGSQSRESGKITISCPKFGGRYSSMRDLEVAKNTLPISIWGVPVRKWAGRVEYSHMGSPRFRIEFVSIWGSTYAFSFPQ